MKKTIKIILIIVGLLLLGFCAFSVWFANSVTYEMNEKITIENENITLIVKNIETTTIENENAHLGLPSLIDGDYYKVEVEMTNNGSEEYTRVISNFVLLDKDGNKNTTSLVLSESDVTDILPEKIAPKQTVSGCLYFPRELSDNKYLGEASRLEYKSLVIAGEATIYPIKLYK